MSAWWRRPSRPSWSDRSSQYSVPKPGWWRDCRPRRVPVPRSFVREHHLSTLRSAPECTARAQPEGEDPMNATRPRTADQVSTLTAPLVAARLEEDGTIQLLVGDPADPTVTLSVALADVAPSAPGATARAHFVESVG